MIALAAASEQQRGWAGPVALIAALAVFRLLQPLMHKIGNRSPTPPAAGGVKPVAAGRLRFTRVDPTRDPTRDPAQTGRDPRRDPTPPDDDPGVDTDPPPRDPTPRDRDPRAEPTGDTWYGRIVERGGQRFRAAAHIAQTGDSPPLEPEPEPRDDFDDIRDVFDPEPDDLDEWLEWAAGVGYNERVRRAMARFGESESTVKRRIRKLKDEEYDRGQ